MIEISFKREHIIFNFASTLKKVWVYLLLIDYPMLINIVNAMNKRVLN